MYISGGFLGAKVWVMGISSAGGGGVGVVVGVFVTTEAMLTWILPPGVDRV